MPSFSFAYTAYDNTVTLAPIAGFLGVLERMDNVGRTGVAIQTVRADGDTIVNVYDIELTSNIVIRDHVSVELRSPVQENDQYTLFERNGFDLGQDIDGDGRSETVDVAIYRRVVAREDLDVRGVAFAGTVRVDTVTRARVHPSRGGTPNTGEVVQRDWYAPGVGVVKRQASIVGGRPIEFEEELVVWDGLDTGLGAMAPATLDYLVSGDIMTPLLGVAAAVPFDSHVLLFSHQDQSDFLGIRSSQFDLRGRFLTTHDYPTVLNSIAVSAARLGNEAFLLGHGATAGELQMARFDSVGNLLSDPLTGIPLPGGPPSLADLRVGDHIPVAVGVGTDLWVAWIRTHRLPDLTTLAELVVRPYDRLGNALAAETIVRSRLVGQLSQPRIVLNGTSALLGFLDTSLSVGTYHYVTLTRSGVQPIAAVNPGAITEEHLISGPEPVSTLTSSGILWDGRSLLVSGSNFTVKGFSVDSSGLAVRAGSGADFSSEDLRGTAFDSTALVQMGSGISSVPIAALKMGRIYDEDPSEQTIFELGHFTPGMGAWASTGSFGRSVRIPFTDFLSGEFWAYAYGDRLLFITSTANGARITVVWRSGLDR